MTYRKRKRKQNGEGTRDAGHWKRSQPSKGATIRLQNVKRSQLVFDAAKNKKGEEREARMRTSQSLGERRIGMECSGRARAAEFIQHNI